jgi:8-oxo-dGTP pyrophosphatase MutT (NUDIX family)
MKLRAGSIVINQNQEMLLIYRKGKWDFPKGKLEKEEKTKEGALRETAEETGLNLKQLKVKSPLMKTTHLKRGKKIKTQWYVISYTGCLNSFVPQKKEGIIACTWVSLSLIETYLPFLRNYAKEVYATYALA